MVFPTAKLAGSTSVSCWLVVLLKVSLLIWVSGTWAIAGALAANRSAISAKSAQHFDTARIFRVIAPFKGVLRWL